MNGESREVALERIIGHIPRDVMATRKPLVFLVGRNDHSSIASRFEILTMLAQSEKRLDVMNIPEFLVGPEGPSMAEGKSKLRSVG
jgi:hypothetical protein